MYVSVSDHAEGAHKERDVQRVSTGRASPPPPPTPVFRMLMRRPSAPP